MSTEATNAQRLTETYLPIFGHQDVDVDSADGMYYTLNNGQKLLDLGAGIAVKNTGHNHPDLEEVETKRYLLPYTPSVATKERADAADYILDTTINPETNERDFSKIIFKNSGAEANETALKAGSIYTHYRQEEERENKKANATRIGKLFNFLARATHLDKLYNHLKENGPELIKFALRDKKIVIAFKGGFHGRTMNGASATGKSKSQPEAGPYRPDVHFAEYNNLESVEELIKKHKAKNISSIIVEPVQGESGIHPADPEFLKGLRRICDENDVILIFDGVQCDAGRTGAMFAYQKYGVVPDINTNAKGMGGGYPVAATLINDKVAKYYRPGFDGTTIGGSPESCARAHANWKAINDNGLPEKAEKVGNYFKQRLGELCNNFNALSNPRGEGLMLAFSYDINEIDTAKLLKACREHGLAMPPAPAGTVRIVPPLIMEKKHVDEAIEKFTKVFSEDLSPEIALAA